MKAKPLELTHLGSFGTPKLSSPIAPERTLSHTLGPMAFHDGRLLIGGSRYRDAAWFKIPDYDGTAELDSEWFEFTFGKRDAYIEEVKQRTHKSVALRTRGMVIDDEGLVHWSLSAWYNVARRNYLTLGVSDLERQKSYGLWGSSQFMSLEWGGYLCRLSKELEAATRSKYGTGETIGQGSAGSNDGPALFAYNSPPLTARQGTLIESLPLLRYSKKQQSAYPGYHPSWRVSSVVDLAHHTVWAGRKGKGKQGYGYPKDIGFTPTCGAENKGYHSESYAPILWVADHASLLAGRPRLVEKDLSEWVTHLCAAIHVAGDPATNRLFVMESQAIAGVLPKIHVFSTEGSSTAE